jgi:cell division protein ZipA
VVDGSQVDRAEVASDAQGGWEIRLKLNTSASARFEEVTAANVGRRLAFVLDGICHSAPVIKERIGGDLRISGSFTEEEARSLAAIFRCPVLPVDLVLESEYSPKGRDEGDKKAREKLPGELACVKVDGEEVALVPEGVSQARAQAVLPSKGSEDMSALLKPLTEGATPPAAVKGKGEDRDFLPNTKTDWVVSIDFDGDPFLNSKEVAALFDQKWRKQHGGMIMYGFDAGTKHWTFVGGKDGPTKITRLQIAYDYFKGGDKNATVPSAQDFDQRLQAIEATSKVLGKPSVRASRSSADAADYAKRLSQTHNELDQEVVLVLDAPKGKLFDGKDVWDVMLCLGLKWGDMDLFNCKNPGGPGDDYYFSVSTTTKPGYFIPESIAQGKVHVADLVFSYSIPRCSKSGEVFKAMYRAVQYAQKRLGGAILDHAGQPAKTEEIQERIDHVVRELRKNGFEPGGEDALRLF